MLPWFVGFAIFNLGPFVASLALSLTNWSIVDEAQYVGFTNYTRLVNDELFIKSLVNTAYYTAIHVPGSLLIAFTWPGS